MSVTPYELSVDIRKALDTTVGTTGAVLVPDVINPGLRMFVETRSPLWSRLRKVTAEGMAFHYKEQNGLPTASFGAELAALPSASQSTFADRTVPIKSIYTRGEISGQLEAASRTYMDVVAHEVRMHALALTRKLELTLVAGDSSVTATEFDGLNKWITKYVYGDSVGDGSGTDQELSLAKLDELIDAPDGGEPDTLLMSKAMSRKLWSILQPQVRYAETEVNGGFRVPTYQGLPIIRLFDNSSILADRVIAFDSELVYIPVLKDFTYMDLARTRDSRDFELHSYLTLVVEGVARHHAILRDVTAQIS